MPCINKRNQIYLQTYNKSNTQFIEMPSSTAVQIKDSITEKFYYIQFSDSESFKVYPLSSFMDPDILESIRSGDVYLMLDNALEYFLNTPQGIYNDIVVKENIPPHKIIFLSAVPTMIDQVKKVANSFNKEEIKVEWFTLFEETGLDAIRHNRIMPVIRKTKKWPKKFLCLNRRWRLHRPFMMLMLHDRNLIDKGHISFATSDNPAVDNWNSAFSQLRNIYRDDIEIMDMIDRNQALHDLGDLHLDTKDLATNRAVYEESIAPFYHETFFSVVNETTYFENVPFLSEKIFKVIAMGHPFILSSAPNNLQYLKELGYKTFHPYIDERYDTIADHKQRMIAIVNEIERLCNLDKSQTIQFINSIRPIVEHNYKVLKKKGRTQNISRKMN